MRSVFVQRPRAEAIQLWCCGRRGWLRIWLPVVFALMVIALESTPTMSAANTSSWLRPVFERFFGHIDDVVWGVAHHLVRKSGHFCGYGMVCVTFLRAYLLIFAQRTGMTTRRWRWQSQGLAVLSTILVASADEWHQSFLPSRTGQVSDVVIDTVGGVIVSAAVWLVSMYVKRRTRRVDMVAA